MQTQSLGRTRVCPCVCTHVCMLVVSKGAPLSQGPGRPTYRKEMDLLKAPIPPRSGSRLCDPPTRPRDPGVRENRSVAGEWGTFRVRPRPPYDSGTVLVRTLEQKSNPAPLTVPWILSSLDPRFRLFGILTFQRSFSRYRLSTPVLTLAPLRFRGVREERGGDGTLPPKK